MLAANETTKRSGANESSASDLQGNLLNRMLRIEWLGQTVASLCWIASVFVYGISSPGDWLQLMAASAWLVANIATLASTQDD